MGFWSLLVVASMPVLQFLLIGLLGAFLASGYTNILTSSAQSDINKVAFVVFSPAIVFAGIAKTVTLHDLLSWWYMPVNIGITYLIGGILGWVAVKILRPEHHLEGLIIGCCASANLGNLPLILIPAVCDESSSPFGRGSVSVCHDRGLSYVSLSMSIASLFIWTYTYNLMRKSGVLYNKIRNECRPSEISNEDSGLSGETYLVKVRSEGTSSDQKTIPLLSNDELGGDKENFWDKLKMILHQLVKELLSPSTIASIVGLIVGVTPWLKSLIIGDTAPLRVIQDSITTLGNGMLPCVILILGGNLIQGLRKHTLKPMLIIVIVVIRYLILPVAGIALVKAAGELGFLPQDPLYHYVLLIQFALPPAMNIGTMAQLFDVAKEECSVVFLWTYLVAAVALTFWSTVFLWLLS